MMLCIAWRQGYLNGTDQEFSQIFTPKSRYVSIATLVTETLQLESKLRTHYWLAALLTPAAAKVAASNAFSF